MDASSTIINEPLEVQSSSARREEARQLEPFLKLLMLDRMKQAENDAKDEFSKVKKRQALMRYITRFINAINNSKASDGTVDTGKSADIKALKEEGLQYAKQAVELDAQAEVIENDIKDLQEQSEGAESSDLSTQIKDLQKQAKALRYEASELRDVAKSITIIAGDINNPLGDKKLTKESVMTLIEGMRATFDDLQTLHQMDMQTLSRMNNEANNILPQIATTIAKGVHTTKSRMAQHTSSK